MFPFAPSLDVPKDTRPDHLSIVVNNASRHGSDFNIEEKDHSEYRYRLIDSTVINASPTPQQLAKMGKKTPDRPIDSDHNMTFQ